MISPFSNWSLLNRLTLGVVLLSAMGVIASDVAAQTLLRSYLTEQMDSELTNVAGGSFERVEEAGIAYEARENEEVGQGRRAAQVPLQRVPTSISVTLIGPAGIVLGQIGGDLNRTEITSYLQAITPEQVIERADRPLHYRHSTI